MKVTFTKAEMSHIPYLPLLLTTSKSVTNPTLHEVYNSIARLLSGGAVFDASLMQMG